MYLIYNMCFEVIYSLLPYLLGANEIMRRNSIFPVATKSSCDSTVHCCCIVIDTIKHHSVDTCGIDKAQTGLQIYQINDITIQ